MEKMPPARLLTWKMGPWSTCSRTCNPKGMTGTSVRTRHVTCVDDTNKVVQIHKCYEISEKPIETQVSQLNSYQFEEAKNS